MPPTFSVTQYDGAQTNQLTGTAYAPKPKWDRSGQAPYSQNTLKGYDVTAAKFPESRRLKAFNKCNGTVNDGSFQWPIFVDDLKIDISLSGSTAQAQLTRDFYPHNFVQPGFVVQGQALDQQDYGDFCEFMHQAQHKALGGTLIQLWINGMGFNGARGSTKGVTKNGRFYPNQMIRGAHSTILCQGYVGSMPRQHQQGMISPTYSFQFLVANMIEGPYSEDMVQVTQQSTWLDILNSNSNISSTSAMKKQAASVLKYAQNNSQNIFNTQSGTGSGNASTGGSGGQPPDGNSYTPTTWASALLTSLGAPNNAQNQANIVAWENAEGGAWKNTAQYNPLNTTQSESGDNGTINSAGVRSYTSWQMGFTATLATLNNGNYGSILSALQSGTTSTASFGAIVGASPWGTSPFS